MMKLLRKIKIDRSGASAAEYALMIALIGGVVIIAAGTLGTSIGGVFTNFGGTLDNASAAVDVPT